jgi:hypothetical protein
MSISFLITGIFIQYYPNYFSQTIWEKYQCKFEDGRIYNFKSNPLIKKNFTPPNQVNCFEPQSINVKLNNFGFRSYLHSPLSPYEVNTLVVGDNYTFGYGLTNEETIGNHLSNSLKFQILDISQPGMSPEYFYWLASVFYKKRTFPYLNNIVYILRDSHFARDAGNGKWHFIKNTRASNNPVTAKKEYLEIINYFSEIKYFFYDLYKYLQPLNASKDNVIATAKYFNKVTELCRQGLCQKTIVMLWPITNSSEEKRRELFLNSLDPSIKTVKLELTNFKYIDSDNHVTKETAKDISMSLLKSLGD